MVGRGRIESGGEKWGPYYYERGKKEVDRREGREEEGICRTNVKLLPTPLLLTAFWKFHCNRCPRNFHLHPHKFVLREPGLTFEFDDYGQIRSSAVNCVQAVAKSLHFNCIDTRDTVLAHCWAVIAQVVNVNQFFSQAYVCSKIQRRKLIA